MFYSWSGLKLFWWKLFLPASSWPPCFRASELREQPKAHLAAAACFRGDNNSLIPRIELYFPSPSSSILLTFTFPPLAPSPPPRRSGSHVRSLPDGGEAAAWRSQCRRGMEDKSKPPYFPSARPISPDWIWRFWSSFSSFSWNYLELLGIKPSPNLIIYFISVFVWENHDYFIRDFFFPLLFFSSPGLLRYSPLDLHRHTNVHVHARVSESFVRASPVIAPDFGKSYRFITKAASSENQSGQMHLHLHRVLIKVHRGPKSVWVKHTRFAI